MGKDVELRRLEVSRLLSACSDAKLLRGASGRAIELAESALGLALMPSRLFSPWVELASYRLAHLLLRTPERDSQLPRIDELFSAACGDGVTETSGPLGALPHIYRSAVLHLRVNRARGAAQRRELRVRMDVEFVRACNAVRRRSVLGPPKQREHDPIQSELFNLLELASYFADRPYQPLTGLGAREDLPAAINGGWILVGPDPDISLVHLSEEFAAAELESRAISAPDALFIRLPGPNGESQWRLGVKSPWQDANQDWIRLLANLLREPTIRAPELQRNVIGPENSPQASDRFRQIKSRLNTEFRQKTGQPLLDGDRLTADSVTIYGVVRRNSLRWRSAV